MAAKIATLLKSPGLRMAPPARYPLPLDLPRTMTSPEILISEVGPRDGLQSVQATMPTTHKLRWIDALVAAGLREIGRASCRERVSTIV